MKPAPPVTRYEAIIIMSRPTPNPCRLKTSQPAVSRILSPSTYARLAPDVSQGDDHSSSLAIADEIQRPTRRLRTGRPNSLPAPRLTAQALNASLFGLAPC